MSSTKRTFESINQEEHDVENFDSTHEVELRRSKRPRVEGSFGEDFLTFLVQKEQQTYT